MFAHWQFIDQFNTESLAAARRQLHHAVQLPAMVGRSFSPPDPEDKYGNLGWSRSLPGFVSHSLQPDTWQVGLNPRELELLMIVREQGVVGNYALVGKNMEQAINWLRTAIGKKDLEGKHLSEQLPYEIGDYQPRHIFEMKEAEAFTLFAALYGNTNLLLTYLSQQYPRVSPPRCWPHHFDLASLKILPASPNAKEERSIGWGLSPGDQSYEDPYFYVNCWPRPKLDLKHLPKLPSGGMWNLEGWIGTTLPFDRYAAQKNQQEIIVDYFTGSIATLVQLTTGN